MNRLCSSFYFVISASSNRLNNKIYPLINMHEQENGEQNQIEIANVTTNATQKF